ncbi:MAG: ATP-dependent RNA helicase RhlE [Parcubacteria group bacterium Gr01-1014_3]|nr:MAG: ATP-dependent RNA helicase RhlE [Parcubacteria group bacterium Gr01-1014_3]
MGVNESSGFYKLGIAPNILALLDKLNFTTPTPIQERCIPSALEGKDLMGIAQTGTGKTLAFGIPMIQAALKGKLGLVVLPTRELAYQVHETFEKIAGPLGLKSVIVIGGDSMSRQMSMLKKNPNIIIGTPGRIVDHIQQRTVSLSGVEVLVLDEADRMLDMGFAPQLNRILAVVPRERQTMLFSATMPESIVSMAKSVMRLPLRVEVAPQGTAAAKVTHELFFLEKMDKVRLLEKLLGEYKGSVLVFTRTKYGAKKITVSVRTFGYTVAELHSNRSLGQRRDALEGFKNGRYRILVATDIAARGIDVKGIELVINFDLPQSAEDYIHRIGRTGRAGEEGHAISFAEPNQKGDVRDIERLMRGALPLSKVPQLPPHRAPVRLARPAFEGGRPGFGSRPGFGRRPGFGGPRHGGQAPRPGFGGGRPSSRPSGFSGPSKQFGRRKWGR